MSFVIFLLSGAKIVLLGAVAQRIYDELGN